MSKTSSTAELVEAIMDAAGAVDLKNASDSWRHSSAIFQALHNPGTSAHAAIEIIAKDESFGLLRGGWLSWGGGGLLMQEHALAFRLIDVASKGEDVLGAIQRAREFAASGQSAVEIYTPLIGIDISEEMKLSEHAAPIPWTLVPEGHSKTVFGGEFRGDLAPFSFPKPTPSCAIRFSLPSRRILFKSNEEAGIQVDTGLQDVVQTPFQVADLVRCAVALSEHTIIAAGSWYHVTDPIARILAPTGYSWSHEYADMSLFATAQDPVTLDGPALQAAFEDFAKLSSSEQAALRVTIDRINTSLRRPVLVDKAIDLGIALEAMMLHENTQTRDRGELVYRTAIRGAAFLGGTREERKKNFVAFRDAYNLRSEAVHVGMLKEKRADATPVLTEGYKLALAVVRKIIELKEFPDWEERVLFGETE